MNKETNKTINRMDSRSNLIMNLELKAAEVAKKYIGKNKQDRSLPYWGDDYRGVPNSFIRSSMFSSITDNQRTFCKSEPVYAQDGIKIALTGETMNTFDLRTWMAIAHLVRKNKLGNISTLSNYEILNSMNLTHGAKNYKILEQSILRLSTNTVHIIIMFKGSRNIRVRHHERFITLHVDAKTQDYASGIPMMYHSISLHEDTYFLFGRGDWSRFDEKFIFSVQKKPFVQDLAMFFLSHEKPYPLTLENIAQHTNNQHLSKSSFRDKLVKGLTQLKALDEFENAQIENNLVVVTLSKITSTKTKKEIPKTEFKLE